MRSILAAVVVIGLAANSLLLSSTEAAPDTLGAAIVKLAIHGLKAKEGVALGVRVSDATKQMKGVSITGESYSTLALSGWPGGKGLKGVVRFTGDLANDDWSHTPIDSLMVEVLVPKYDRAALLKQLDAEVRKLGTSMNEDDEVENVYWCDIKLGDGVERDLWIGMGDGVIVMEFGEDGRKEPLLGKGK